MHFNARICQVLLPYLPNSRHIDFFKAVCKSWRNQLPTLSDIILDSDRSGILWDLQNLLQNQHIPLNFDELPHCKLQLSSIQVGLRQCLRTLLFFRHHLELMKQNNRW